MRKNNDHLLESQKHLNAYNNESLSDDECTSGLKTECDSLAKHAEYFFSWDKVPGTDDERLKDVLRQNFGIEWLRTAKIEKIDDDNAIKISTGKNSLSLRLGDEKTKVTLEIDDGGSDEFIAKEENDKLNIYHAEKSYLKELLLPPLSNHLLPNYVRADRLALRYQKIHILTGSLIYALAAAAVATVTFYMLFFPGYPKLLWLEFAEVTLILLLMIFAHFGEWQRKWIDYRFLAERLRVALFLCVADVNCKFPKPPPFLNIPHLQDDWTLNAFSEIWSNRPQAPPDIPIAYLKNFLRAAWIDDQVNFYKKASKRHGNSHTKYARTGEILFAMTIVVATLDAFVFSHSPQSDFSLSPNILASLAIILPTASAALAGIRVHREYLRNAERYSHMARYLSAISDQIKQAQDMVTLTGVLEEVNEMIFLENWDWRATFYLRKTEVP